MNSSSSFKVRYGSRSRVSLFITLATCLSIGAVSARADDCWSESEMKSAQLRELQTRMMVAALQCRNQPGSTILADYNSFMTRFRGDIGKSNDVLKNRFVRLKGNRDGQRAYDTFTTAMANAYGAGARDGNYCADMTRAMQEVIALQSADLMPYAQKQVAVREDTCIN